MLEQTGGWTSHRLVSTAIAVACSMGGVAATHAIFVLTGEFVTAVLVVPVSFGRERTIIGRQAAVLSTLVEDLSDVSRFMRGRIAMHQEPLDMEQVIDQARETVTPLLSRKGHSFELPHGGLGISPDFLPHLFEPFTQKMETRAYAEGGLGLGLAIVRAIVTAHGGTIAAYSQGEGRGSEFVVRLPVHAAAAVDGAQTRPLCVAPLLDDEDSGVTSAGWPTGSTPGR